MWYTYTIRKLFPYLKTLSEGLFKLKGFASFAVVFAAVGAGVFVAYQYTYIAPFIVPKASGGTVNASEVIYESGIAIGVPTPPTAGAPVLPALFTIGDGAVLGASDPLSNLIPTRDGLKKYKVRSGDTLSGVAAQFGISLETLRWANPGITRLQVGQELLILPVTGILYEVQSSDTLESIAGLYGIDPNVIRDYNTDYQKALSEGSGAIVLPYAKPLGKSDARLASALKGLPELKNYFSLPVAGWNWGELHDYNAVDIANRCGTSISAAADGLVIPDETLGNGTSGWNSGYGLFVLLEHSNGTKTRYAHLASTNAKIGGFVSRGDKIGTIGNTGNTHGPTGCHLHFEVYGAKNPFAVR